METSQDCSYWLSIRLREIEFLAKNKQIFCVTNDKLLKVADALKL